jgi:hypothetical protein
MSITEEGYYVCDICGDDTGRFNDDTGNHWQCEEVAELRSRINTLEAERRWIPVSERLPENGRLVLCVYHNDMKQPIVGEAFWSPPIHPTAGWAGWTAQDVTHWMPLPSAPEAE